jgi:hypothetical protein
MKMYLTGMPVGNRKYHIHNLDMMYNKVLVDTKLQLGKYRKEGSVLGLGLVWEKEL